MEINILSINVAMQKILGKYLIWNVEKYLFDE